MLDCKEEVPSENELQLRTRIAKAGNFHDITKPVPIEPSKYYQNHFILLTNLHFTGSDTI